MCVCVCQLPCGICVQRRHVDVTLDFVTIAQTGEVRIKLSLSRSDAERLH